MPTDISEHAGDRSIDAGPKPRVDPAGRPLENRGRQALIALAIVGGWIALASLIFRIARVGGHTELAIISMFAIAIVSWFAIEVMGGRQSPIWPSSALAITASISLGFAATMSIRAVQHLDLLPGLGVIAGTSALSMAAFLFRFRLPGLVSPVITFTIIALFLALYNADPQSLSRVDGISARGILAALIDGSYFIIAFGTLSAGAIVLARHIELSGDEFGMAAARPLHIIGAGIAALIAGRAAASLPEPYDWIGLAAIWLGAWIWGLRLNRIAVTGAMHLAIAKPVVLSVAIPLGYTISLSDWVIVTLVIIALDIAMWPKLHHLSLRRGWTVAAGGRIPRERDGWIWRYWPYA